MDEDIDFERRRELRRQKREEMQRETEKTNTLDDDEEVARERRRQARQDRLRNKENEELNSTAAAETNSTETTTLISGSAPSEDDEQALLERIAKREARRQRRMKEALERQKEFDPTITDENATTTEDKPRRKEDAEESHNEVSSTETNSWKENVEEKKVEVQETAREESAPHVMAKEVKQSLEKEEQQESTEKTKEQDVPNEEENISINREFKENTENVELASTELEKKEVEGEDVVLRKARDNLVKEDENTGQMVEVEVKVEPSTPTETNSISKKPEENFVEVLVKIQDEPPVKRQAEETTKELEKTNEPDKESPKISMGDIEVKVQIPDKEEEKPQVRREFEVNVAIPKKEDEKPQMQREGEMKVQIPKEEEAKPQIKKEVDVKVQISKKEEEIPHMKKEVEIKVQVPKKEEEIPHMKKEVEIKVQVPKKEEEKLSTLKKKVEEPATPKKEVEDKPRWKKEAEEAKSKPENKTKLKMPEVVEEMPKPSFLRDKKVSTKLDADDSAAKAKKPEKNSSLSLRSPDSEKQDPMSKLEAERKLQELKRRRNETDSETLEKMKQKQQMAEAELEELKKKREERKKILEEEEKEKKQQLAEKKAKEEEERRKMKEEIERRRAEAAEKKKQKDESKEGSKAPFIAPKGASAKIGEKAEFLNKSALKSPLKISHTPLVCKIGNRLEQYNSALQTKDVPKSPKSPLDVPVAEGVRNIKSMWEKGNVATPTTCPTSPPAGTKETAGLNTGVSSRINTWKTKTPEQKPAETKPTPEPEKPSVKNPEPVKMDQKPAEVTKTRGLWEPKGSTPVKVSAAKSKFVTNGTRK